MSALLAILVLLGLVGQDDVSTISKEEVKKIVRANFTKIEEIGGQEITTGWSEGDIEDDTPGGE